ncbi:reverse transcriptase domain-containing protein [Tanacetum coccineum]
MQTRPLSKFVGEPSRNPTSTIPKRRNRRRPIQRVEPFSLVETPVVTMADQCTMAELLRAPTEGYAEAIVVPPIPAEHFELKHSLINLVTSKQFFGFEKEDPHAHIRYFNKITSTLKYKDVPETSIKLMLFPFSIDGPARIWLDKEPPRSILTWVDLETFSEAWDRFKDLLRACPHYGFTELHQLDTFYNSLIPSDQDSLNSTAGGNLLERSAQDVLKIIKNKSKVHNSRNKPIVSQVKASNVNSSEIASAVASAVTSAMTAMFKQHQVTPAHASVKAIEESCVTCGGNRGNNFNEGNTSYQAPIQQTQVATLSDLEKFKKTNEASMQAMRNHISNLKSELRSEMQSTMQNQNNAFKNKLTNDIKSMMASFFQMNTASSSGSGSLPSNSISNPKGKLKSITTQSGIVLDGPSVPMPPPLINPMNKEKQQDKDEIQIHKFWQMFKQLHINISLDDALILILKYQKMLKALLSNKEKLLELENTPLNENCSAVILKKLPKKLGDPRKFIIPCSFSELNCKALADLGASINLMPLSVWKKLGLSELISTRMTLELANRSVCIPAGIARDVFVSVGRFTFPANFVIVNYESDPRVPLILGRPFLRTARALIDVHGEELILRDCDERLIMNMKHGTSSYSNKHQRESINMIDIYNISYKYYLEDLFANEKMTNHLSGNPTFSSEPDSLTFDLTSPEDLPPSPNVNPLSGSTTSSFPSLTTSEISDYSLEEFTDELALITFPLGNDDLPFNIEFDHREIEYLLNHDPTKEMDSILEDSVDEGNLADPNNDHVDTIPEMFTDEHTLDYSSPPLYDDVDDDLVDTLISTENKEKVFNPGILVHENLYEVTNRVTPDKNVKKISSSNAFLILEDYNPPLSDHELPFHIEIPGSGTLRAFSSENEEKVFNLGILISKGVHSLLPELSHRDSKAFKVINIFESPMEIFPCSYGEDIRVLDIAPDYEASCARGFVLRSLVLQSLS